MVKKLVWREPVKSWSGDGCVTQVGGGRKSLGKAGLEFDGKEALGVFPLCVLWYGYVVVPRGGWVRGLTQCVSGRSIYIYIYSEKTLFFKASSCFSPHGSEVGVWLSRWL